MPRNRRAKAARAKAEAAAAAAQPDAASARPSARPAETASTVPVQDVSGRMCAGRLQ